jgi:hypothetical protein
VLLDEQWSDVEGQETVMLRVVEDGSLAGGQGVYVMAGRPSAQQVVELAEQVVDWAVEALWGSGRSAIWPECPVHPNTHLLDPTVVDGRAVWQCPKDDIVIGAIGALRGQKAAPPRRGPGRHRHR